MIKANFFPDFTFIHFRKWTIQFQNTAILQKIYYSGKGLEDPKFGTFLNKHNEKFIKTFMQLPCFSSCQDLRSNIKYLPYQTLILYSVSR